MNPFNKFNNWFNLAKKTFEFDPTAFALSSSSNNKPDVRMVLLKKILPDGYIFFTNINSNKGKQFNKNNNLAMCFYWESLKKQIRISGRGFIIDDKEFLLKKNQSTFIPLGSKHRLTNPGKLPLVLIEVQSGDYLGEDDIVRFQDDFGRK